MTPTPLAREHLVEAAEAVRAAGAVAYAERLLDRHTLVDPQIRALVAEPDRAKRVRREAAAAGPGALHAVGAGVKDIVNVAGLPTRAGSELPPEVFAGPEAGAVTRLRAAGAYPIAKTVTTMFAFGDPGPTRNPHATDHTPGGSSSGSAAGVAAGMFPLALGSQTVGSVIRPAAFCGVVGFKPTYGRIPIDGVLGLAPSVDTLGAFTQDVAGMRVAAAVLCDDWREAAAPATVRAAVPSGPYIHRTTPEGRAAFDRQVATLRAAGIEVTEVPAFEDFDDVFSRHQTLLAAEAADVHAAWFDRFEHLYGPMMAALVRRGRTVATVDADAARGGRGALRDALESSMDAARIDVWLAPAATGPAPAGIESTGDPVMNLPWTHAGLPVATVPAGDGRGMPVGLQVAARRGDDERLLAWTQLIAEVLQRR